MVDISGRGGGIKGEKEALDGIYDLIIGAGQINVQYIIKYKVFVL